MSPRSRTSLRPTRQRNGYARPDAPLEVVAIRATARRPSPVRIADLPPVRRTAALGPTVVAEADCTIWVPAGWQAEPHRDSGAMILTRVSPMMGPAELAVLVARLTGVAHEMGEVLRRSAFSPNIKERADCSAALFTADGTLLVQAEHIPVHLGSMPASVAVAIDALGDQVGPDDQVILNDPFAGGTHLNDVTLVAPVFDRAEPGRLIGWVANRAHHADLGGTAPGSMPADATHIDHEGFRLSPTILTPAVAADLAASSRTPDERVGDLDAQVGANRLGARRFAELGSAGVDEVVAYGERRMRAALAELPDGTWTFRDVLDSFGPAPDQQIPTTIAVTVTVDGRSDHLRLHRDRPTAARQRQRRGSGDGQLGGVGPALGPRPDHPGQRWCAPVGRGDRACWFGRRRAVSRRGRGRQRRGQPAGGRRLPRRPRPGGARSGPGGIAGNHEQPADRRRRLGVVRDDRRWPRRPATSPRWPWPARGRHERGAHGHDQHPQHPGRGVRAGIPGAGRALHPSPGQRRGRCGRWRRRHRAGPPGPRARDGLADHRAPSLGPVGPGGGSARAQWGRTGCSPVATRRRPSASPTSARSTWQPATSFACAPRAAAAGASWPSLRPPASSIRSRPAERRPEPSPPWRRAGPRCTKRRSARGWLRSTRRSRRRCRRGRAGTRGGPRARCRTGERSPGPPGPGRR